MLDASSWVSSSRRTGAAALGLVALGLVSLGCSATPPPSWQQGGARLTLTEARWDRGDDDLIELRADGQVLEDGDVIFVLDVAGRVVEDDHDPIAILLPDGFVVGTDDQLLGRVGVSNASPPGSATAWLALMPDGSVVHYDGDGDAHHGGRWQGCDGPARRTCTLVTHLVRVRQLQRQPRTRVGIGIGIGF